MTETTTPPEPNTCPINLLFTLVITLLAPMFLGVAMGNIALARAAAIETVNAYRARHHADLIAIAQIVAFGLAALGSLSLSMDDNISPATASRLRANANACNRSAEQNRCALAQARTQPEPETASPYQDAWTPEPEEPSSGPDRFLSPEAAAFLETESLARLQESVGPGPRQDTISPKDAWTPQAEEPTSAADHLLSPQAAAFLEAESLARLEHPAFPDRPRSPIPPQTVQPQAARQPNTRQPPTQQPAARKNDGRGPAWADAMAQVARELAANLPNLSGAARNQAKLQLSALTSVINDLNRT